MTIGEQVLWAMVGGAISVITYKLSDVAIRLCKMHRKKIREERVSVRPARRYDSWE